MTFGEHLEELRRSLGKALIWLVIGTMVGIYFSDAVIRFVQTPLQQAIRNYYADRTLSDLGYDPEDPKTETARTLLTERGLGLQTIFVSPKALAGILENLEADTLASKEGAESGDTAKGDAAKGDADANSPDKPSPETPTVVVADTPIMSEIAGIDLMNLQPLQILSRVEDQAQSLASEETFMMWMKAGLLVGAVFASPMIFWHIWQFVAAGLYPHERRYVYLYLPFSLGLFWAGAALAFFGVLALVLNFFLKFNSLLNVDPAPRLNEYVSFVLLLPLGFGISFQLPLVMLLLERIGIFQLADYTRSWRIAILVIAVIAMILTPADVTSMMMMAVPLWGLYFLGIFMCKYMPKGPGFGSEANN